MIISMSAKSTHEIFAYIFGSYTALTFHRRTLSFVSHILRDSKLLTTQQLGAAASANAFVFAVVKFISWTFVNRIGAKSILIISLIFASITALLMSVCPSFIYFFAAWALAGVAHGCSWPPCGFFIRNVCSVEQFGVWWGIISSSSNVSALAGPILTSILLTWLGFSWEAIFIFNGLVCFLLAIAVARVLPDIKQFKGEDDKSPSKAETTSLHYSWHSLFANRSFMFLCLAYIVLSTVKFSFANWIHLCLIDSDIQLSFVVYYVTFMELGGLIGSFSSGFITDWISKYFSSKAKARVFVLVIYTFFLLTVVYWLHALISKTESPLFSIWWNAFIIGCLIASCYSLFGMLPMEMVGSESAGRYSSILDLAGSIGSLLAGYPISLLQSLYGWSGVIVAMQFGVATACATLVFAYSSLHVKHDVKLT